MKRPFKLIEDLQPPRKRKKRLGLPMTVFKSLGEKSIMACPDSGSEDNIMSRSVADMLGLSIIDVQDPILPTFVMANGGTVSAIGKVHVKCAFKQGF